VVLGELGGNRTGVINRGVPYAKVIEANDRMRSSLKRRGAHSILPTHLLNRKRFCVMMLRIAGSMLLAAQATETVNLDERHPDQVE